MKVSLIFLSFLFFASVLSAADAPAVKLEKDYFDAVVLLIEHKAGLLGIQYFDEATGAEEKHSFRVDPEDVYVADALNRPLEFTDVQIGDRVDVYSEIDASGKEAVIDIIDYSRFEKE